MTTSEKFANLLTIVLDGTRKNKFTWRETADEDTFSSSLGSGVVFLYKGEVFQEGWEGPPWIYRASLYADGRLIEELECTFSSKYYSLLEELYVEARRSARETDETLDNLLNEVEQISKQP
jgi:hypothetical protein